ncbi:MAG: ABC transporter permease [Acidobacteriota bacterium]
MGSILGDIRLAVRRLKRSPGFAAAALLILILSIGANSTIFTVVNRFLLEPLPVERPSELVSLNYRNGSGEGPTYSYPDYRDLRDRNDVLAGLIVFNLAPVGLSHQGNNGRSWAYLVSGNYFDVLGVKAVIGRTLTPADDDLPGAHPLVVLSYGFWQRRFGGENSAIGSTLKLNGRDFTIVGVTPKGFYGTERIFTPDIFAPLSMQTAIIPNSNWLETRDARNLFTVGRLKPGVASAGAAAALNTIAAQLTRDHPDDNRDMQVTLSEVGLFGNILRGPFMASGILLLVLAGAVLLVACANVAGLLLARATGRSKETAIRLSVGATRGALIREVMMESLLLCLIAGIGGVLLATWMRDLLASWAPPIPVPIIPEFTLDARVLALSFFATLAASMLCGLAPGLQSVKAGISETLKRQKGTRTSKWRMQDVLIGSQVALSMILLIGSLLVANSLSQTLNIPIGFDPVHGASVAVDLNMEGYNADRAATFRKELIRRVRSLPGIESASLAGGLPLALDQSRAPIYIEGQPAPNPAAIPYVAVYVAGQDYFRTMRTRLQAGREFEERDDPARTAIVNSAFVRRYLDGRNPLGAHIRSAPADPWREIVGVVEDGKYLWVNEDPRPVTFLPVRPAPGITTVVARSSMPEGDLVKLLRTTVLDMDPALSVFYDGPLSRRVDFQLLPARFLAVSLGSFGFIAVLLVGAGLYGILAYAVSQRTKEIGIRMALGASPGSVIRAITGRAGAVAGTGMMVGIAGGLALGKLFSQVLYGINPYDPVTLCAAIFLMTGVGFVACWVPVRKATRVDPLTALRID